MGVLLDVREPGIRRGRDTFDQWHRARHARGETAQNLVAVAGEER